MSNFVEKTVTVRVNIADFSNEAIVTEAGHRDLLETTTRGDITEFDDEELTDAYRERFGPAGHLTPLMVFEALYVSRAPVPDIVREYFQQETGRTLP